MLRFDITYYSLGTIEHKISNIIYYINNIYLVLLASPPASDTN